MAVPARHQICLASDVEFDGLVAWFLITKSTIWNPLLSIKTYCLKWLKWPFQVGTKINSTCVESLYRAYFEPIRIRCRADTEPIYRALAEPIQSLYEADAKAIENQFTTDVPQMAVPARRPFPPHFSQAAWGRTHRPNVTTCYIFSSGNVRRCVGCLEIAAQT